MNDKLLEAYSGDKAVGYDARRKKTSRWRNEVAAMEKLLSNAGGSKVLDCPFGTGRWVPQYVSNQLDVVGVDLSSGMLGEAETKISELADDQAAKFELVEGSIFDLDPKKLPQDIDLIACIRFLNWISLSEVKEVVRVLTSFGTKKMILGASVIPQNTGAIRNWWYRVSLDLINKRHPERPTQYVHHEKEFLETLGDNGWQVTEKHEIMRRNARVNYFYLVEKK